MKLLKNNFKWYSAKMKLSKWHSAELKLSENKSFYVITFSENIIEKFTMVLKISYQKFKNCIKTEFQTCKQKLNM